MNHLPHVQLDPATRSGLSSTGTGTLGYRRINPATGATVRAWTNAGIKEISNTAAYYGPFTSETAGNYPFIEVWGLNGGADYGVEFRAWSVLNPADEITECYVPWTGNVTGGVTPTSTSFECTTLPTGGSASYDNMAAFFISGALGGEVQPRKSWNPTTHTFTFWKPYSAAPAVGDSFILIPMAPGYNDMLARVLGLSGDLMVEDDVVMDPNGSGFRISWNYYLYDTEAHRAAHVYQSPNATRTGLVFKYSALRHIQSGIVVDFSMSRVL